jgi:hypothetical protein
VTIAGGRDTPEILNVTNMLDKTVENIFNEATPETLITFIVEVFPAEIILTDNLTRTQRLNAIIENNNLAKQEVLQILNAIDADVNIFEVLPSMVVKTTKNEWSKIWSELVTNSSFLLKENEIFSIPFKGK